jgi:MarR family transcriptional regulator, temperature-dependent positive regulator of motility
MSTPGSIVLITRLSRAIYRAADEGTLGMKLKAYSTLASLAAAPVSQQELCISMHLDPNNCVLLLNHLETAGWIERQRDPADRRRHIVALTDDGRKALRRAERAMEDLEGEVLAALSPDERVALQRLLARAMADEPAAV